MYALAIMFMGSCTYNHKIESLLNRADSLMDADDDSINLVVSMLHTVESQLPSLSKKQEMRYKLLNHKVMNKAYMPFKSDIDMLQVVNYY